MDIDLSATMSRARQAFEAFISNGWYCIIVAVIVLVFAVFSMSERQSSAGSWFFIVVAVFLFMIGLGNLTGLGFSMSF